MKKIRLNRFVPVHPINEHSVMIILAVIVGALGGYGAVFFRWLIRFFQNIFFGMGEFEILDHLMGLPWYGRMIPPVIGGAIVGPIIFFLAKETRGSGVPDVMQAVALRGGIIRKRVALMKSLASSICIGSGGSAGREGPIIQIGSAIGSMVGQFAHLSEDKMKTLVGCGAAAGIAATFNAPIAGVMFTMEIILGNYGIATFSPIVVSSVTATVVSRVYLGSYPAFFIPQYTHVSSWEFLLYILLGVIAGMVGVLYTTTLYKTEDLFGYLKIPEYAKATVGGVLVGIIGIFIPQTLGVGYDTVGLALFERLSWQMLLILVFIKIIATSITIGSRSSGGVIGPAIFIGAMTGGTFGYFAHSLFPAVTAPSGAYSLVGMGAVLAAATHGPLHAMLIIFEMTGNYKIIVPLMLACTVGYAVASRLNKESIFTSKLVRKGIDIKAGREINIMKSLLVEDAMTTEVDTIAENMHLKELLRLTFASRHTSFPVIDSKGMLSGIVTLHDFKDVIWEEGLGDLIVVKDISVPEVITVTRGESLNDALGKIGFRNIEQLPVVDEVNPRKIIGILSRRDIFAAYNRAIIKRSMIKGIAKKE
ncbi:MAG: chloride channel protein [Deltaproteobacteria bacterium]|nr:chloride channel protein [Deltaproteobacteria bacterium]